VPNLGAAVMDNKILGFLTEKPLCRPNIRLTLFQNDVRIPYEPADFLTSAHSGIA